MLYKRWIARHDIFLPSGNLPLYAAAAATAPPLDPPAMLKSKRKPNPKANKAAFLVELHCTELVSVPYVRPHHPPPSSQPSQPAY